MKIAIPLDENKTDVCMVLARTPFFLFWEDGEQTIAENPAAQAQGGAGIQAAQFLVDSAADLLITPRCGQNAAEVFTAAGMKILKFSRRLSGNPMKIACLSGKGGAGKTFVAVNLAAAAGDCTHGGFQGIQ